MGYVVLPLLSDKHLFDAKYSYLIVCAVTHLISCRFLEFSILSMSVFSEVELIEYLILNYLSMILRWLVAALSID
jgi:hypothetical protein